MPCAMIQSANWLINYTLIPDLILIPVDSLSHNSMMVILKLLSFGNEDIIFKR